jgi:hypothetical protein
VVLDQSTVIFQKGGEGCITICVVLDQNHGNVMFYQLVSNLLCTSVFHFDFILKNKDFYNLLQYTVFYGLSGIQPGF